MRLPAFNRRRSFAVALPLRAGVAALACAALTAGSACTLVVGVDNDDDDPTELRTRLPDRVVSPEGEPAVEPSVGEPGVPEPGVPEPGVGEPGVPEPGVGEPGVPEPEGEPDALTIDLAATTFDVTPDGGLYANLTDASTVTLTVVNLLGDPMEGLPVQLLVASGELDLVPPPTGAVVTPSDAIETDLDGIARFNVTTSLSGSLLLTAQVTAVDGVAEFGPATVSFDLCVSDDTYFDQAVAGPVLTRCVGCHNDYGRLIDSAAALDPAFAPDFGTIQGKMRFKFADSIDAKAHNIAAMSGLTFTLGDAGMVPVDDERAGVPYLLAKPMGLVPHGGGVVLPAGDPAIVVLTEQIERLASPDTCIDADPFDLFAGVEHGSPLETFRRAQFTLTGRFPTAAEEASFGDTPAALNTSLDGFMQTQAFYDQLREVYNDVLLTEENNVGTRATAQLNANHFPNSRKYFFRPSSQFNGNQTCDDTGDQECCINVVGDADFCAAGRLNAVATVSREALALLEHVVKNDLPFTDVLTADYTMINPYSAAVYGLWPNNDTRFTGVPDPMTTFEPGIVVDTDLNTMAEGNGPVPGLPHSGLLTMSTMLQRYPTTGTNINRHRARHIYSKFLDIDVMEFLNLVIDQNEALPDNLFTEARTCSACHAALDPVAGLYKNFRGGSRYNPQTWFNNDDDIRPAGFKGEAMDGDPDESLRWLAGKLIVDERFALSAAKQVHFLVLGRDAMKQPTNPGTDDYEAKLKAYAAQALYFQDLAERFRTVHNHNLKELIKDVINGPYFTANGIPAGASAFQQAALHASGVGRGVLLTPEQLDRKLVDTLGFPYHVSGNSNQANQLLNAGRFRLLMGGIDSDIVLTRFRDPFPIMAAVSRRMSNEMACLTIPQDFAVRDAQDRKILREVELDTVPEDEAGAAIPENATAIRTVLKRMHYQLLGEVVDDGDAALEESYALFVETWRAGNALMVAGDINDEVPSRCRAQVDFFNRAVTFDAEGSAGPGDRVVVRDDPAFVARSFMAVTSYFLTDYKFLFE